MRSTWKLLLSVGILIAAVAILVVLWSSARHRGRLSHCRNNLRLLGQLTVLNWQDLDPERTGRDFWQAVREARYKTTRGEWLRYPEHDPALCPVYGRTVSDRDDPKAIDYRGPKEVRDELRETPKTEPIGADRPGNHPDGGIHVLRLDTSVEEVSLLVDLRKKKDPLWAEAGKMLRD